MAQLGVLAVACLPLVLASPRLFGGLVSAQDEGQLLAYPSLMLRGYLPNTDFVHVYGVNQLLVLSSAFRLFGESLEVERAVGLAVRLIVVAVMVDVVRRVQGLVLALTCGVVAAAAMAATGLPAYSWYVGLAVGVGALWLATVGHRPTVAVFQVIAWALAAFAIGVRVDLAPAVLGGLGVVALLVPADRRWSGRLWAARGIGLALGALPFVLHLLFARNVLRDTVLKPVLNSSGRRLPLWPADVPLGVLAWTCVGAAVITVVVLLVRARCGRGLRYRTLAPFGCLSVFLLPQMLQRLDPLHVLYVAPVIIPVSLAAMAFAGSTTTRGAWARSAWWVMAATVMALAVIPIVRELRVALGADDSGPALTTVTNDGRDLVVITSEAPGLEQLLAEVGRFDTPECRGFVQGPSDLRFAPYSDTTLYWMLPSVSPASRFLEFNPGDANAEDSELSTDLESANVAVLSSFWLSPYWPGWAQEESSRRPGPDLPNRVFAERFVEVGRFDSRVLYVSRACLASVGGR
jgi:hypothetical protein